VHEFLRLVGGSEVFLFERGKLLQEAGASTRRGRGEADSGLHHVSLTKGRVLN
jgi:hypothetical protein